MVIVSTEKAARLSVTFNSNLYTPGTFMDDTDAIDNVELVGLIVEMGQGVRAGIITRDFFASGAEVTGKIKLEQFAQEFKAAYLRP